VRAEQAGRVCAQLEGVSGSRDHARGEAGTGAYP
jgi:hypothetical protein